MTLGESSSETLRERLLVRDWSIKYNLARYFGVEQAYKMIKSAEDRKIHSLKEKVMYR